jgi:hypothetical protein
MLFGVAGDGHAQASTVVIGFLHNLRLLLLMFASGAETKGLFNRQDPGAAHPKARLDRPFAVPWWVHTIYCNGA